MVQKYHGGMDGFDAIKQLAHDNATPPDSYKPTAGAAATLDRRPWRTRHSILPSGPPTDIKTMASLTRSSSSLTAIRPMPMQSGRR